MRVKISYSIDVPRWYRREIRRFYGEEGIATRQEVKDWFAAYGFSMDDELGLQADAHQEEELDAAMG